MTPRTPSEVRLAFLSAVELEQRVDPLFIQAVNELFEKLESAYCGLSELTPIELLFGRSLFQSWKKENT